MRFILGLIILFAVLIVATPIIKYGTTDPCRMLAKDIARESYAKVANAVGASTACTSANAVVSTKAARRMIEAVFKAKRASLYFSRLPTLSKTILKAVGTV